MCSVKGRLIESLPQLEILVCIPLVEPGSNTETEVKPASSGGAPVGSMMSENQDT